MKRILLSLLLVTVLVLSVAGCMFEKVYTVTFDTDGGSAVTSQVINEGGKAIAPTAPTKLGHTFAGWYVGETAYDFDAVVTANVALKAKWTLNTYTVTFDADNGTENTTATVEYGKTVAAPAAPTKAGYTFAGWFVGEAAYDFEAAVTADVTVKAAWTVNQYTITFDTDGGSEIAPIVQDFGTAVTAPATPEKAGYTFAGWDKEIPATMPIDGVIIKALWTANQYTIIFDTDGGSEIAPIVLDFGAAVTAPAAPEKAGYTFAGWDKEIPATMPIEGVTVKALWTVNQYTITFDTNGGSEIAPITLDFGATVVAPAAPTKLGYFFAGWNRAIPTTMPAENITIKAAWTVNQYTITFDTDGGSEIAPIKQNYATTIVDPANPTKEGYTFAGWDGGIPETMPAENITIKALWTLNQYTVTFDAENGTEIITVTVNHGETVTAPANPTKDGHTFGGWYNGENAFDIGAAVTGDLILKALWTTNSYTVIINADNGSDNVSSLVEYGTTVAAPADPTKVGYTFQGWFVDGVAYDFTAPITDNITIKAAWTVNQYTITFDTDGGNTIDSITQNYGTEVTIPADPTKEGYTFTGWDVEIPTTMPAENVTVKALWTLNTYTVIFNADNGTPNKNVLVNHGATVDAITDPTMTGYTFDGWFVGNTLYDFTTPVTGELTLTAKWTMITYNVTVDTANGVEATMQTVNYGNAAVLPTDLVKPGFKFVGWTLNGEAYDVTAVVTGDITIVATWEVDLPDLTEIAGTWTGDEQVGYTDYSYEFIIAANGVITASYNNGYTDVALTINYVLFENNVLTINYDAGSVEGANLVFTLSGDKGSLAAQAGVMGTAVTLYKTFTVTFDWGNYKSEVDPTTKTVSSGSTVTAPSKSWTGYEIKAWYLNGEVFDLANTPITSDITLVAEWGPKMLTVTFYGQDGITAIKTIVVAYNTPFGDLADQIPAEIPTTDGFKFNGKWYTTIKATSPVSATAKITSDKEYFPGLIAPMDDIAGTWTGTDSKGNAYTMVVDAANQTVAITTVNGDVITEYNVASIYYKDFSGTVKLVVRYTTANSSSETTLTLTYTAEGTFTGSNSLVLQKQGQSSYTVTFDSDGGSAVEAQTIAKDATAQEPVAPTKDGYTFAGWYNGETLYDFATPVTGDITLTAKWEEAAPPAATYIVTFTNGTTTVSTQEVVAGEYAVAPTDPSKSGKKFMGWYDGETKFDATAPINGDFEFVAKWGVEVTVYNQSKEVVKTFIVEDGTVIPAEEIPEAVVNEGFVFTGTWHKSYTVSAAPVDITAPVTAATKLYPGVIAESVTVLAGTWTGEKVNSDSTVNVYTFIIDVAVDGNNKVTGATVTVSVDGVNIDIASIQYNASSSYMQLAIKYYKEGSSSASTYAVNYYTDGTVKLGSPSLVLTKIVPQTVTFINGTTTVSTQEVLTGQYATAPADPSKSGKKFMGWYDGETKFDAATPIMGDFTFVAKWGVEVTIYNQSKEIVKTFIVEDGTVIPADEIPEAVVNEGFVFTGTWHKSYTVSAAPVDITAPVTAATKLYPGVLAESVTDLAGTWTGEKDGVVYTFIVDVAVDGNNKVTGATVTVSVDGVIVDVASIQYNASSTYMQLAIKYYKEGSSSASTYAVNYYTDGTVKLGSPSLVLKKFGVHTVTFNTDGADAIASQTVVDGETVEIPVVPTKEGFTFAGWYLDDAPYNFETPVTTDITLTAKWEAAV